MVLRGLGSGSGSGLGLRAARTAGCSHSTPDSQTPALSTANITSRLLAAAQSVATPAARPRSHGTISTITPELEARISSATACQDGEVCGSLDRRPSEPQYACQQSRAYWPRSTRGLTQSQARPDRGGRGKVRVHMGGGGPCQQRRLARSCSGRRAARSTLKPRAAAWRAAAAPMPEDAPVTTAHDARSLAAGEASAAESSSIRQSSANIANTTLSLGQIYLA